MPLFSAQKNVALLPGKLEACKKCEEKDRDRLWFVEVTADDCHPQKYP